MVGWKIMYFPFGARPIFRAHVSVRECKYGKMMKGCNTNEMKLLTPLENFWRKLLRTLWPKPFYKFSTCKRIAWKIDWRKPIPWFWRADELYILSFPVASWPVACWIGLGVNTLPLNHSRFPSAFCLLRSKQHLSSHSFGEKKTRGSHFWSFLSFYSLFYSRDPSWFGCAKTTPLNFLDL